MPLASDYNSNLKEEPKNTRSRRKWRKENFKTEKIYANEIQNKKIEFSLFVAREIWHSVLMKLKLT